MRKILPLFVVLMCGATQPDCSGLGAAQSNFTLNECTVVVTLTPTTNFVHVFAYDPGSGDPNAASGFNPLSVPLRVEEIVTEGLSGDAVVELHVDGSTVFSAPAWLGRVRLPVAVSVGPGHPFGVHVLAPPSSFRAAVVAAR